MRELTCDFLIVGSGAAGTTLAATLAELSHQRIILLEKGGHFEKEFFNQREWDMANALYAEEGARSTDDRAIPVRGGECVGGGTTVNIALCFDPVKSVWDRWQRENGLEGFSFDINARDYGVENLNLATSLNDVRTRLGVHRAAESELNRNNRLFEEGCQRLGIRAHRFELNMRGCISCGFCGQGCAYDAKQGTMVTYLRDALARGVQLIHHCDVSRLELEERSGRPRATGAVAQIKSTRAGSRPNSVPPGSLRIRAKTVIVSAGAIETPCLLVRSGHPDPYRLLGRGLVLHPSLPIVGIMREEVAGHRGIEGAVYSDHFFETHGFYFECLFGHPQYGSAIVPSIGVEHFELMLQYSNLAGFGVMLVDTPQPRNRVEWDAVSGKSKIHYRLSPAEVERLRFAAARGVEIMFAAGAREVFLPSEEPIGPLSSPRFNDSAQARYCRELKFLPHQTTITSSHCQSTTKMSSEASLGLLNSRGESHHVDNLIVCDSSAFPSSCGANPMISIMTMARYQGRRIAAELDRYAP